MLHHKLPVHSIVTISGLYHVYAFRICAEIKLRCICSTASLRQEFLAKAIEHLHWNKILFVSLEAQCKFSCRRIWEETETFLNRILIQRHNGRIKNNLGHKGVCSGVTCN